ncbi:MAG: DUF1684 domain-containing protein [Ignavibacteriales bacterium]|nr:MAG: DUF1684 domain-containing protein [Ignavibacteriales bacterium]
MLSRDKIFIISALVVFIIAGCAKEYSPEIQKYINEVEKSRVEKNEYMKNDPSSPFNFKGKIEFHPLKYFDINPEFVFESKLTEYDPRDTVIILGTKGEERKLLRYGYFTFKYSGKEFKLNVYEGTSKTGETYHMIQFTDKTTGEDTYGVGRYIDFELSSDKNIVYTIDFNLAYNPYCAYSKDYSCAIPTKEDHLDLAIEAGEKNYH